MWKSTKKFIKIAFYTFVTLFIGVGLFAIFNQDKILAAFKAKVNEVLTTEVKVDDVSLTLFEDFPNVSVKLDHPIIFDAIPGSIDTFVVAQSIYFSLDIVNLLQGNYNVDEVSITDASINIKIDKAGNNNYTILKSDTSSQQDAFSFDLEKVSFSQVNIHYIDQRINNNHKVFADALTAKISASDKHFNINLNGELFSEHLGIKGEKYLQQKDIALDCNLEFLSEEKKLIVSPSSITIGESKFNVEGSYINNTNNTTHLAVNGDETNIQTIIALLPNSASKTLQEYKSEGKVYFIGKIDGNINDKESPSINFEFGFKNASFYHPATKQKIEQASLVGHYTNGKDKSTSSSLLELKNVQGSIGNGTFNGSFLYQNFDAPYLKMNLNADLDISKIVELYPVDEIKNPKGRFKIQTTFDGLLSDLKKNTSKVQSNGSFSVKNTSFIWIANDLKYHSINGDFLFNNNDLGITNFECKAGNSDFQLNGFFKNFVAYIFLDNVNLKMEAGFSSNKIDLDELLSSNYSTTESTTENNSNYHLNISPRLGFDLDCHIKELKFRNLKDDNIGKNLVGDLHLMNQKLSFNRIDFSVAKGKITTSGNLNFTDTTNYNAHLSGEIHNFGMNNVFTVFENFGQTFITNRNLSGTLNADFNTNLFFDNSLNLKTNKLLADVHMQIDNGVITNMETLEEMGFFMRRNKYDKYLKDNDLSKVAFSQLKNSIHIENKNISIPDMEIKSSSADFNIRGTHSFDNKIDYYVSIPIINYQKREDREEAGVRRNKDTGEFFLYLQLLGTTDDFEFIVDKKNTVKTAKDKIKNEIKNVVAPIEPTVDFIQLDIEDTTEMLDFSE